MNKVRSAGGRFLDWLARGSLMVMLVCGIFFFSVLVHESVHVIQGDGAGSVCLDYNLEIDNHLQQGFLTAHTVHDATAWPGISEAYSWQALSEKYAGIAEASSAIIISVLIGFAIGRWSG